MNAREVHYQADGLQLVGTLAIPDGPGPHPAVLAEPEVDPTRITAIGYCFGGTLALERRLPVDHDLRRSQYASMVIVASRR